MLPTTGPSVGRQGKILGTLLLTLGFSAIVLAAFGILYVRLVRDPAERDTRLGQELLARATGLRDNPVANRLDARFVDADSDLVADAPADAAHQVDPPTLSFSYIAVEDAEAYKANWTPFLEHLSRVTGKPVEYAMSTSPREQLKALREGTLHVTGLNTGNVPTAVNTCGFVPVCVLPTDDATGSSRMRLIVPSDSAVRSPAGLKGLEITLTDPGSNSGYKAALVLLKSDFGLLPGRDFTIRYSMGHDASIQAVADHRAAAAAVADDMLGRALASGAIKPQLYRSVYESEKFPTAGLGYAYNLRPELAKKVREALLSFDWKGTPLETTIGSVGGTKFIGTSYKNDWPLIRRIDDAMGQARPATE